MVLHLGFELPKPPLLDAESETLTEAEAGIVKKQIRKNTEVNGDYVQRIDLFVNQEKYPRQEKFVRELRERMFLLMEENDTFRRLLWRHLQGECQKKGTGYSFRKSSLSPFCI